LYFFAILVVPYWFTGRTLDYYLSILLAGSNMFYKIANRLFEDRRELVKLPSALKYVLLVHRNLWECSSGHLKILLKSVNEILKKSPMNFSNLLST
jgi:hypothetical protein